MSVRNLHAASVNMARVVQLDRRTLVRPRGHTLFCRRPAAAYVGGSAPVLRCSNAPSGRPAAACVGGSAPVCRYSNVPSCRPAAAYVGGTGWGWVSVRNLYAASVNMVRAAQLGRSASRRFRGCWREIAGMLARDCLRNRSASVCGIHKKQVRARMLSLQKNRRVPGQWTGVRA